MNSWISRRVLSLSLAAGLTPLGAQEQDLASMDLEQLMDIRVTSVQRREQSVAQSAAAVTVLTREDIQRSGASTLPEVLRLAPGLHVARVDAGFWAIGARGFNGQFANKLLVMVDGRSVYHPVHSGVLWDTLDLVLDDVERIEVIRGPGAVMWGANAVNGVINIITRRPEDSVGGYAEAGTGTIDRGLTRWRWGQHQKQGFAWRISGQFGHREPLESNVESGDEQGGNWQSGRVNFRLDWDRGEKGRVELHADALDSRYRETYFVPAASGVGDDRVRSRTRTAGTSVMGRWTAPVKGGMTTVQFYRWDLDFDREAILGGMVHVNDAEVTHRRRWGGRQEWFFGAGWRGISDDMSGSFSAGFEPGRARYDTWQATVMDEWEAVRDRLRVSAGFRAEYNSLSGANLQPMVRGLWSPGPKQSVWAAASRSVRTPSRWDLHSYVNLDSAMTPYGPGVVRRRPSPDYETEKMRAYEVGYRQTVGRVGWDVAVFWSQYRDYRAFYPAGIGMGGASAFLYYDQGNLAHGRGIGAELAAQVDVTSRWRLSAAWTQYGSRVRVSAPGGGAVGVESVVAGPDLFPRFQARVASSYQLRRGWQANALWYAEGGLPGAGEPGPHNRLDVNLQWRVSEWGGADFGVQNAVGNGIQEFRPEDGSRVKSMGRTWFVRWRWWF